MNANPKEQMVIREVSPAGAEQRPKELDIKLPPSPGPFGAYVEAVQSGNLLFRSGTAANFNRRLYGLCLTNGTCLITPQPAQQMRSHDGIC